MDPIAIAMALAQFAPSITKLFTGSDKAAEIAEKVVGVAQAVTGTKTPEAALGAIQANPELVLAFQQAMGAQQADLEKAYLADRSDARGHDVDVRKLNDGHNRRADIMVALDVIGLIACLVVLCFFRANLPPEAIGLISTIAATFGLCLRDAHQFEFGSSRSSQNKDATISSLTK